MAPCGTDRVTTREDIEVRWHWQAQRAGLWNGLDPAADDVGRHSALISGKRTQHSRGYREPDRKTVSLRPDTACLVRQSSRQACVQRARPRTRFALVPIRQASSWLQRTAISETLFRWMTEGTQTSRDQAWMRELLCDIREELYPQPRQQDALIIRHIAETALECEARRTVTMAQPFRRDAR